MIILLHQTFTFLQGSSPFSIMYNIKFNQMSVLGSTDFAFEISVNGLPKNAGFTDMKPTEEAALELLQKYLLTQNHKS